MNPALDNQDSRAEIATKALNARGNLTAVEAPTILRHQNSNGDEKIPTGSPPNNGAAKKRLRRTLAAGAARIVALATGVYYFWFVAPCESTEDATIEGRVTSVAPQISGRVAQRLVQDNQEVKQGGLLLELKCPFLRCRSSFLRHKTLLKGISPQGLPLCSGGLLAAN
jgi:hypothetical protein